MKRVLRHSSAAVFAAACLLSLSQPAAAAGGISGKTIVVDPGHGGKDPGAIANGIQEKTVTLPIAQQLASILQAQGVRVVMTRSSDVNPAPNGSVDDDLQARVSIAQQAHADAFVSIHANQSGDPNVSGATTYYGPVCGYYSGATMSPTDVGRSYSLARKVQASLVARTQERDNGAKNTAFWVLGNPGIPAILVETAFLSNPGEAAKLKDPGYQHLIADAIGDGLNGYFGSPDSTSSPTAPADALASCSARASKDDSGGAAQPDRWVQTFLATGLMSGTDAKATTFASLPAFTYLKWVGQQGNFLYVVNPDTNGPGYVDASKVGPSGPPPPPPVFQPFWVENFKATQLWSGLGAGAVSFGALPVWSYLNVVAPQSGPRLFVRVPATGNVAYVDATDVGPSGPPPTPSAAPAAASAPAPASPPTPAASKPPASATSVVVAQGDTLSAIGQRFGVSVDSLISANHLTPDGLITIGQKLVIPGGSGAASPQRAAAPAASVTTVTVNDGDTLSAIAARYGVSVQAIVSLNGLDSPDNIRAGQTLKVPGS